MCLIDDEILQLMPWGRDSLPVERMQGSEIWHHRHGRELEVLAALVPAVCASRRQAPPARVEHRVLFEIRLSVERQLRIDAPRISQALHWVWGGDLDVPGVARLMDLGLQLQLKEAALLAGKSDGVLNGLALGDLNEDPGG